MSHPAGNVNRVTEHEVLVRACGLTKRFGDFTAVDGIDFDLYRGEAFGFLGPNGAGKSSTMRMIGCVSPPTSGDLVILGRDPVRDGSAIRARLGVGPPGDNPHPQGVFLPPPQPQNKPLNSHHTFISYTLFLFYK